MRCSNHRGSALLIVLGMLSFMIVSAVSFSIYMRQSRTPSTFLRRAVSSRYLLKAALANAINRLDGNRDLTTGRIEGIYDDAYPGVGPLCTKQPDENGDYWDHRVYMPFGPIDPIYTASTLSLEGLAYLPPAIINEVRAYSRQTQTAVWSNLGFDMGRYVFCAVDVSDCYDLNKVRANERRTSAPNRRFGPAYAITADNAALDAAQDKVLKTGLPYTSVADFNLYMGDTSFTPFMGFIGSTDSIYDKKNDAPTVSNALFITDTWFPPTNRFNNTKAPTIYNLAGGSQPFTKTAFKKADKIDLLTVTENKSGALGQLLLNNLGGVGMACLFDYLDADSRPISFCTPSVETVPMVSALGFVHDNAFSPIVKAGDTRTGTFPVVTGKGVDGKDIVEEYTRVAERYELTRLVEDGDFVVNGSVVFPFKRTGKKGYEKKFKVGFLIKIFMGPKVMETRVDYGSPLYPGKWPNPNTESFADGVLTLCSEEKQVTFDDDIHKQQDAVKDFNIPVTIKTTLAAPVFWYVYCKDKNGQKVTTAIGDAVPPYYSMDGIKDNAQALKPYAKDGKIAAWWTSLQVGAGDPNSWPKGGAWSGDVPTAVTLPNDEYVPHVAVWACVKNGNGEVVDLVPAKLLDDREIGMRTSLSASDARDLTDGGPGAFLGKGTPLLSFRGDAGQAFTYSYSDQQGASAANQRLNGQTPTTFAWNCLYAPDPRYNWAPENWLVKTENAGVKGQVWLDDIVKPLLGTKINGRERDHDIFLFTSDQELLQSAGELAFLPALEDLDGTAKMFEGVYPSNAKCTSRDLATNTGVNNLAAYEFFWQTYTPWDEDVYNLPLSAGAEPNEIASGIGDFRMNPFSQDPRLFTALVTGTPFDYAVASTNDDTAIVDEGITPAEALEYCFASAKSSKKVPPASAQLEDDDLELLAQALRNQFTSNARAGRTDWYSIYNNLAWDSGTGDDRDSLFGVSGLNVPLHTPDRKFLYSFWRECLQNRQQLFLVFLRAEPLTVGGMGRGSLAAAQMGARGVALVWRSPNPPTRNRNARLNSDQRSNGVNAGTWRDAMNSSGPHRTRVLFYRQFD